MWASSPTEKHFARSAFYRYVPLAEHNISLLRSKNITMAQAIISLARQGEYHLNRGGTMWASSPTELSAVRRG